MRAFELNKGDILGGTLESVSLSECFDQFPTDTKEKNLWNKTFYFIRHGAAYHTHIE